MHLNFYAAVTCFLAFAASNNAVFIPRDLPDGHYRFTSDPSIGLSEEQSLSASYLIAPIILSGSNSLSAYQTLESTKPTLSRRKKYKHWLSMVPECGTSINNGSNPTDLTTATELFHDLCSTNFDMKRRTVEVIVVGDAIVYMCNYRKFHKQTCYDEEFSGAIKVLDQECGEYVTGRVKVDWDVNTLWKGYNEDRSFGRAVRGHTICGHGMRDPNVP